MKYPRVTINLPVFNGEESLRRQLDSIAGQTFTDFRVLITDNASTDRTEDICREFEDKDPRFQYRRNSRNRGLPYSASLGYQESALSEFGIYASHSDHWAPTYLEKCVEALEANPKAVLAYSHCSFFDHTDDQERLYFDSFDLTALDRPEDRFLTLIEQLGMCTPFYGLIRGEAMADHMYCLISQLDCGAGPDNVFLAALSLDGPFIQVPEPLFFRESPRYIGEDLAERYNRLSHLGDRGDMELGLPFIMFLHAHMHLIWMSRLDFAAKDTLIGKALQVLMSRYKDLMREELAIFTSRLQNGSFYSGYKDDSDIKQGQFKFLDLYRASTFLNYYLERAAIFFPKEPNVNHVRAVLRVIVGQPQEAIQALNQELAINPTHRDSLELRAKLQASLGLN